MGMFDWVRCDMPLPDGKGNPEVEPFQTKDFGCELSHFRITAEGRLVCDKSDFIASDDAPSPIPSRYKWCEDFHGRLRFYTSDSNGRGWREYSAKFTEGLCEEIVVVEGGP